MFQPPAAIDDLADHPALKQHFQTLWNDADPDTGRYMGAYVTSAATRLQIDRPITLIHE